MMNQLFATIILTAVTFATPAGLLRMADAQDPAKNDQGKRVEFSTKFDHELKNWKVTDDACWKTKKTDSGYVLSLHKKKSSYKPKVRSPYHIALLKEHRWMDFELNVDILSTHKDYNHRDVCLFFGYQSPSQFYYVHLGKKTDPHANQIFIVNNKARTKISTKTTDGTPWDDKWHKIRIRRDVESGKIEVFFDDMEKPWMTAEDKTFGWGQVGLGSFDDTADFANLKIVGTEGGKEDSESKQGSANQKTTIK